MRTRRSLLAALTGLGGGLAGCAGVPTRRTDGEADETTSDTGAPGTTRSTASADSTTTATTRAPLPEQVGTETVAEDLVSPVAVEFPPGDDRPVVVDQVGVAHRVGSDGRETFLDVRDRMVEVSGYDERGFLGLAFHPDYANNGRLFARYSAPRRSDAPGGYSHTFVLSEFAADPSTGEVDPDSERLLLEIAEPQANHNAGAVAFGPDGYLYVGVGDGGGGGDRGTGHVEDWYGAVPGGNGQDVTANLLGSVLRLDADGGDPYAVPEDNPLVGREGLDEQYAWGLRNPWRFSFDPAGTRIEGGPDLYVADVGQNEYEEVDLVRPGGNYGWNVREATACFDAEDCPTVTPDGELLRDPVVAYPHSGSGPSGVAVVGGYVYRREDLAGLAGRYVFADWQARGRLFVATPTETGMWPVRSVPLAGDVGPNVLSFGRDGDGCLYVCTSEQGTLSGESGAVHRLVPAN
jgi:glucose/arabinose dehydrogenase